MTATKVVKTRWEVVAVVVRDEEGDGTRGSRQLERRKKDGSDDGNRRPQRDGKRRRRSPTGIVDVGDAARGGTG